MKHVKTNNKDYPIAIFFTQREYEIFESIGRTNHIERMEKGVSKNTSALLGNLFTHTREGHGELYKYDT